MAAANGWIIPHRLGPGPPAAPGPVANAPLLADLPLSQPTG